MKRPGPFEQVIFAVVLFFGFILVEGQSSFGTWAWCNLSQTYACYIWRDLYKRGGLE